MAQPAKSSQAPKDFMGFLEYYLVTKSPVQLPEGVKEVIVKFGPWVDLVLVALMSPALLLLFGIGAFVMPLAVATGDGGGLTLALVALAAQLALMLAALPGLFQRKRIGWTLSLASVGVNLVYSVLQFQLITGLIGAVIGAYVLFQIKSYYK